ncbi:MAG: proteasome subunit beta [Nitrososphaeria archaeon]|nr:proteasome subunit beta [Nitrososphaeria archaeon]NIN52222.1 proteasome subunit beta [Nitrososphaeria archaeon]NIQ32675.1 proteasome subunit beta [Nitrososphaeria archaeon]
MDYFHTRNGLDDKILKGTTTIALVCSQGAVVGADTRVISGYLIAHKKGRKIFTITPRITVTMAGVVADAQALIDSLKYNVKLYELRNKTMMNPKSAARLLSFILFRNRMFPLITELLVAGVDGDGGFSIYRLDPFGSLTQDDFSVTGSGSPIAIGVLENEYKKEATVEEAIDLVAKALHAAMKRDLGSGDDFDIVVVGRDGVKELGKEEKDNLIKRVSSIST